MKDFFLRIDKYFLCKFSNIKNILLFDILSRIGHFLFCFPMILILFLIPDIRFKEMAILSFFSMILDTLLVFIIKHSVKRKRYFKEGFYLNKVDPYSFPSGHISRLAGFIFPTMIFPIISTIFFFFSIVSSISRMAKGYHFFSDCFFGFIIGFISGFIIIINKELFINYFYLFLSFLPF